MTICKYCKAGVADFYLGGERHECRGGNYPGVLPKSDYPTKPVKCDLCGSTAIDHTENQCNLNRTLKKGLPNE